MIMESSQTTQDRRKIRIHRKLLSACVSASFLICLLAVCGTRSASAQFRSGEAQRQAFAARAHHPSADQVNRYIQRAKAQDLSASDVANFQTNLQSLVNWLGQTPMNDPNQQSVVNDVQTQINSMTPDQMTSLASNVDVVAFNNAVSTLTGAQPTPHVFPPSDPPANLVNPPYGYCAETAGPPAVPSDPTVDKDLLITIEALTAAKIVIDDLQNLNIEIAGEQNNAPAIVAAIVIDEIVFALQTASDEIQFCDPYDEAAEVYAGWQNTIVIDTDIANLTGNATNGFTDLGNQLTAVNTDIDNHIASIASTTNTQFPQLNTQLTTFSTNIANQEKVVDADIDNHLVAFDLDLSNHVSGLDADVKNTATGINTDLDSIVAGVDSDALARDTKIDSEISTIQTLEVRLEIEHALTGGLAVGIFELPASQGGYLETLRAIVSDAISKMLAAGQSVGTATKTLALGDTAYASKQYKSAYQNYLTAYQTAVH